MKSQPFLLVVMKLLALLPLVASASNPPASVPNASLKSSPPPAKAEPTKGDPVGVFSGNVYELAEDLRIRCPDIDLVFRRSYSSGSKYSGPLGFGWTHSYDWRIETNGAQTWVHTSGDDGPSDVVHVFNTPDYGNTSWNARGFGLSRLTNGRWLLFTPDALTCNFDANGLLISISTFNGSTVSVSRNNFSSRIETLTHSCGKKLMFEYRADGLLSRVNTPDPCVYAEYVHIQHGEYDVLTSVVRHDVMVVSTNSYRYASSPSPGTNILPPPTGTLIPRRPSKSMFFREPVMVGKTDANGIEGTFRYLSPDDSPFAKCAFSSLSGGLFTTYLSFSNNTTEVASETGSGTIRTVYRRDESMREVSRRYGVEEQLKNYDSLGNITSEVLTNSISSAFVEAHYQYDGRNRAVLTGVGYNTAPTRFVQQSWDDRRNIPNRTVTPEGRISEWTTNGNELIVYGAGVHDNRNVTKFLLDENEHPIQIIDSDGGRTEIEYNGLGYVKGVAREGMPEISIGYDALGNINQLSIPGPDSDARTIALENNWRGLPLAITNIDGTIERFEYEKNGRRVVRHIDALGREDVYGRLLGRPIRAKRIVNGITNLLYSLKYDRRLNTVAVVDPSGRNAETYMHDENERIIAVTNLEGQVLTREYAVGNFVVFERRFDGTQVDFDYDIYGNLASVRYPDEELSFCYDRDGLLLSASNSAGVVSNTYDASTGWLMRTFGADGEEVSYTRRNGGGVASIVSVAGTTRYSFDSAGRKTQINFPSGEFKFGYCNWNGKLSAITNGNGLVSEYAYNLMDRVTNITWRTADGAKLGGFAYEYDAVGRIVSRSHALGTNAFNRAYAYDDFDRLSSDGGVSYTYDAAGNRTTKTENGETITYSLGVGDRLASWTDGAYSYDAAGCVTRIERDGRPTLDLTWNSQYQLVSVATNGVFAEGYTYDALGRRVSTTTLEGTTRHVYDDNWQVIADIDANGNAIVSYTWGEGIDNLLAVKIGGATYYPLTDIQGTVWGYIDTQNNIVARWQYDAWGNVVDEDVAIPVLASLRYRFQGREWSVATGLINFRMRWYDPVTGRWLSKDPIGLSGGLNLYEFCHGDPMDNQDPKGNFVVAIGGVGSAGASTGVSAGSGVVIGYSRKNGFQIGTYQTGSLGSHIGLDASFGLGITIAPGADDICDIAGCAVSLGGSGGVAKSIGVEVSVPINGNSKGMSITVSGGVGVGVEGHVTITNTQVQKQDGWPWSWTLW